MKSVECYFLFRRFARQIACKLYDLNEYDEDDDGGNHDFRTEALIAIADCEVTEAAAADGTCHCPVHRRG